MGLLGDIEAYMVYGLRAVWAFFISRMVISMNKECIGLPEAAEILGVHYSTLRKKCKLGLVPAVQIPGAQRTTWRIPKDTIAAMLKEGLPK